MSVAAVIVFPQSPLSDWLRIWKPRCGCEVRPTIVPIVTAAKMTSDPAAVGKPGSCRARNMGRMVWSGKRRRRTEACSLASGAARGGRETPCRGRVRHVGFLGVATRLVAPVPRIQQVEPRSRRQCRPAGGRQSCPARVGRLIGDRSDGDGHGTQHEREQDVRCAGDPGYAGRACSRRSDSKRGLVPARWCWSKPPGPPCSKLDQRSRQPAPLRDPDRHQPVTHASSGEWHGANAQR
jgi:hypothetical protein